MPRHLFPQERKGWMRLPVHAAEHPRREDKEEAQNEKRPFEALH
jgi:hypothetical protein